MSHFTQQYTIVESARLKRSISQLCIEITNKKCNWIKPRRRVVNEQQLDTHIMEVYSIKKRIFFGFECAIHRFRLVSFYFIAISARNGYLAMWWQIYDWERKTVHAQGGVVLVEKNRRLMSSTDPLLSALLRFFFFSFPTLTLCRDSSFVDETQNPASHAIFYSRLEKINRYNGNKII